MNLKLSTPVSTPELAAILGSVGAHQLVQGTIYTPIMQLLIAPAAQGDDAVALWELTQRAYANKDGSIDLSEAEVKILKAKLDQVAFPWLKARLLDILKPRPVNEASPA